MNKINRTDEMVLQENIDSMINLIVYHQSRQSGELPSPVCRLMKLRATAQN